MVLREKEIPAWKAIHKMGIKMISTCPNTYEGCVVFIESVNYDQSTFYGEVIAETIKPKDRSEKDKVINYKPQSHLGFKCNWAMGWWAVYNEI